MYKLFVAFSSEAQLFFEENGTEKVFQKTYRTRNLRKGYDWDIKEFGTAGELGAYTKGMEDANGWSNEPMWHLQPVDFSKQKV